MDYGVDNGGGRAHAHSSIPNHIFYLAVGDAGRRRDGGKWVSPRWRLRRGCTSAPQCPCQRGRRPSGSSRPRRRSPSVLLCAADPLSLFLFPSPLILLPACPSVRACINPPVQVGCYAQLHADGLPVSAALFRQKLISQNFSLLCSAASAERSAWPRQIFRKNWQSSIMVELYSQIKIEVRCCHCYKMHSLCHKILIY